MSSERCGTQFTILYSNVIGLRRTTQLGSFFFFFATRKPRMFCGNFCPPKHLFRGAPDGLVKRLVLGKCLLCDVVTRLFSRLTTLAHSKTSGSKGQRATLMCALPCWLYLRTHARRVIHGGVSIAFFLLFSVRITTTKWLPMSRTKWMQPYNRYCNIVLSTFVSCAAHRICSQLTFPAIPTVLKNSLLIVVYRASLRSVHQ